MPKTTTIAAGRLLNHHLTQPTFEQAADVVRWLGAVQAQEYAGAKWALALRMQTASDDLIEQAFTSGAILRTHVMRPTWHFVTPADIRWLLALTAPRLKTASASYYRQLELDEATLSRTNDLLAKALEGGKQLTRSELASIMEQAGIAMPNLRMGFILYRAELDMIVCSGARSGKQHTYALFDERVPPIQRMERDEALAELARRYFTSHGPATIQDFVWWSGLTVGDARAGLDMVKSQLAQEDLDGKTYWFAPSISVETFDSPIAHLLPPYDEYIVGYTDRSAIYDPQHTAQLDSRRNPLFNYTIAIDGRIVGAWKRTFSKGTAVIETASFRPFSAAESEALAAAASRFGKFLKLPVTLS